MQVPQVMVGILVDTGEENVQGMWDSSDALKSSTWRELRAVDLVCQSIAIGCSFVVVV